MDLKADSALGELEAVAARYGVAALYLFGSQARGSARPTSDVDIGALFAVAPPRTLDGVPSDLADDLIDWFGRPVDLVVLNDAPSDLVHRVLRDGQLLVERDRAARVAFEVRKRNEYFDLVPHLRRYRQGAMRMLNQRHDRH
jgi:predicted nucleotidyltransferase